MIKKRLKIDLIILTAVSVFLIAWNSEKPRVLIIGDSISIGYTPFVKENLSNNAYVYHNLGNAQHTGTGLEKIEEWLGSEKWDIIQFNWGLWDLCYRHPNSKAQGKRDKINGEITFNIDEYSSNLDSIVSILQTKTEAKLVFVTTTYIPENEVGRFKNDAIIYNNAAKKIMKRHSVTVNDLYEQSISIHRRYGKGLDDVHYSSQGYEKLSELVTGFLKTEIESMKSK